MIREGEPKRWRDTLVHNDPNIESATRLVRRYDADTVGFQAKENVWLRLNSEQEAQPEWSFLRLGFAVLAVLAITFAASKSLKEDSSPILAIQDDTPEALIFSEVTGVVYASPLDGKKHAIRTGESFTEGAIIRTSGASASTLRIPNLGKIQIGSHSELSINLRDDTLKIDLFSGRVLVNIEPKNRQTPVQLFSGDWRISVIGTIFEVTRSKDKNISVHVSKGTVELSGPGRKEKLSAGQSFSSNTTSTGALGVDTTDKKESGPQQTGKIIEKMSRSPAGLTSKRQDSKRSKRAVKARRGNKGIKVKKKGSEPKPLPVLNPVREKALRSMVLPETQLSEVEVPSDLLQYQSADEEKNPIQAIKMFDSVAESDSPHAEVAAHRAAKLTLEQGNSKEALRRYQVIRNRFPAGVHSKATVTALLALRLKDCKLHEGRGDLNRFLRENPNHTEDKDLAFLSGELYRRTKKYDQAIKDYTRSLGSQYDEDAMYFKAWCHLAKDKSSPQANRLIEAYQKKYPKGRYADEIERVLTEAPEDDEGPAKTGE